ncbi:MAG: TVP38/TMEM64 family protein [Clostridia bacterium]|nr:TVP38/TMEM64 family protein [Clostridia bacterium]
MEAFRQRKKKTFLWIGLGVLLLPVLIVLLYTLTKKITGLTPDDIFAFAGGNVFIEMGVVLLIYAVKSVLFFIPIAFCYILTGNLFPPMYSILLNILGVSLTLTLTFFLGKKLGKNFVEKIVSRSKKAKKFMEDTEKSNVTLFALRASNIFPVELISLVCGCSGYGYWSFLGLSLLAMVPTLIPFSIMGEALKNPMSKEFWIPFAIVIVMMVGSLIFYKLRHKDEE